MENTTIISGDIKRFLVGELVEVRQTEKGLRGSWHPAVVIEVQKGKRKVEYDELLAEDGSTKLQETVPVGKASDGDTLMATLPLKASVRRTRPVLRPRPPSNPYTGSLSWPEGLWVDCYYDDAWWEGVLAEDITSLVCEDVASLTAKSNVSVFFPEENDLSSIDVKSMRIGQDWDEDTGHWSLKGCVPVPVLKPNKRARTSIPTSERRQGSPPRPAYFPKAPASSSKPLACDSAEVLEDRDVNGECPKEECLPIATKVYQINDTPPDSDLLDDSTVNTIIVDIGKRQGVEDDAKIPSTGATSSERRAKKLFSLGGKGSATVTNDEHEKGRSTPKLSSGAARDSCRVGVDSTPLRGADEPQQNGVLDEEVARKLLTDSGWRVQKHFRKKVGKSARKVQWQYKSPKYGGSVRVFASLAAALNFEAEKGPTSAGRDKSREKEKHSPLNRTEVDIGPNSNRKPERTSVEVGQKLRSDSVTPDRMSYQENLFGRILNSIETSHIRVWQVDVWGFYKDQVEVVVESGDLVIKGKYLVERQMDELSFSCHGSLNSRVKLPKDVEHHLISAEVKSSLLTLTLPKSKQAPAEVIEVQIH